MQEQDKLIEMRQSFERFFRARATRDAVRMLPTIRNARDTHLAGRIYEETQGNRIFVVSPHERHDLDGFVKTTGLNDESLLLQTFMPLTDKYFGKLWDVYMLWIQHSAGEETTLRTLLQRDTE